MGEDMGKPIYDANGFQLEEVPGSDGRMLRKCIFLYHETGKGIEKIIEGNDSESDEDFGGFLGDDGCDDDEPEKEVITFKLNANHDGSYSLQVCINGMPQSDDHKYWENWEASQWETEVVYLPDGTKLEAVEDSDYKQFVRE